MADKVAPYGLKALVTGQTVASPKNVDPWADFLPDIPAQQQNDPWADFLPEQPGTSSGALTSTNPNPQQSAGMEPIAKFAGGARISRGGPVRTPEQMKEQRDIADATARGFSQGVTLGAGDELYGAAVGAGNWIKGDGYLEHYERARDENRAGNKTAQERNPLAYGAGQAAGGLTTVAVGGALPGGARALGMVGGNLATRAGASALSGGVMGGVQGFMEGEGGFEKRLESAQDGLTWGAGVGLASPFLGLATGKAVQGVGNLLVDRTASMPGFNSRAVREVADALSSDTATNPALRQNLEKLGPEGMLLDAGPSTSGMAQGIGLTPGDPRSVLVSALQGRRAGTNARIAADLDGALGPAPVPSKIEADLISKQGALSPEYEKALAGATAVDTKTLADHLDTLAIDMRGPAQKKAQQLRELLNIPGTTELDPHPRSLLEVRKAIDGMMAGQADSNVLRVLGEARRSVDDTLAASVPGLKAADEQWADLARQKEALKRGSVILDSGKEAVHPSDLAESLGKMSEGEVGRLKEGVRADIDRRVGTMSNDFLAVRDAVKGEGDWNRAKLTQIFGQDQADQIINAVDREAAFAQAYKDIVDHSQTAQRRAAQERVKVRGQGGSDDSGMTALTSVVGGPQALAAKFGLQGAGAAKSAIVKASDEARNADIARLLITKPGEERDALFEVLTRNAKGRARAGKAGAGTDLLVQMLMKSEGDRVSDVPVPASLKRLSNQLLRQ